MPRQCSSYTLVLRTVRAIGKMARYIITTCSSSSAGERLRRSNVTNPAARVEMAWNRPSTTHTP